MKKQVLIVLLAILTFSCNSDEDNSSVATIESTLIAKSNLFGNGQEGIAQQNMVIRDQSTWESLIAQMNSVSNVTDNFTETDIDFSQYTIIAVFDEIKPNGGHVLDLNVVSNSGSIVVQITDLVLVGDDTGLITQPFHIVKIPVSGLPIVFE